MTVVLRWIGVVLISAALLGTIVLVDLALWFALNGGVAYLIDSLR